MYNFYTIQKDCSHSRTESINHKSYVIRSALETQKIMIPNENKQSTKMLESQTLPIRKRKIEQQTEHDITFKNSSNPDQSSTAIHKEKKSIAILDAALSLVEPTEPKAKHKMKNEFEKFPETVRIIMLNSRLTQHCVVISSLHSHHNST